jgi:protein-tyrosine phosphatase
MRTFLRVFCLILFTHLSLFAWDEGYKRFEIVARNGNGIPKVLRTSQLKVPELEQLVKEFGVSLVLNLRRETEDPIAMESEKKYAEENGIEFVNIPLNAKIGMTEEEENKLTHTLIGARERDRVLYIHCKAGRDRTGMVAAMAGMVFGQAEEEADHHLNDGIYHWLLFPNTHSKFRTWAKKWRVFVERRQQTPPQQNPTDSTTVVVSP